MNTQVSFASPPNFLDPQLNSDGTPYGTSRYKEIVNECFLISKFCNTSYADVKQITPREREYLLEFINDDLEKQQKALEEVQQSRANRQ